MSAADYALGIALLGAVVCSLGYGAVRVRARLLPDWSGAEARLAEIVLGLAALIVVPELLGTVGLFERWVVAPVLVVVGLVVGRRWGRAPLPRPPSADVEATDTAGRIAILGSLAVAGVVLAQWSAHVVASFRDGVWDGDSLWYHLPFAARFVQDGSVVQPLFTDQDTVVTYFPANGDVVHGLVMLPFGNDFLVPLVNIGWLALAMLAAWCIGKRFGAPALALGAVSVVMSIEVMAVTQAGTARNDVVAVALFLSAVALLVHSEWSRAAIGVAAVATGLTLGVKLSVIVVAGLLVIGVVVAAPRATRRSVLLPWLVPSLGIGAFWYVRNLIVVGNPLPWLDVKLGPLSLPSPLTESTANSSVIDRLTEPGGWTDIIHPGLESFSPVWWLLAVLAGLGVVGALVRPDRITRMLGVICALGIAGYLFTPNGVLGTGSFAATVFTLNLRYVMPATALALVLLTAWPLVTRAWVPVAGVAVSAVLVVLQLRPDEFEQLWEWQISSDDERIGVALVALAAAVVALVWVARRRPRALIGIGAVIAVGGVVAGGVLAGQVDDRYRDGRAGEPSSAAWPWAQDLPGARIALVGDFFQYPFTGRSLQSEVRYAGVELDDGGYRPIRTCRELRSFLADQDSDFVVIAPRIFVGGAEELDGPRRWVRSVPGTTVAFRDGSTAVFRLGQAPDPDDCS